MLVCNKTGRQDIRFYYISRLSSRAVAHSERRLFTGLAKAAFTD